MTQQFFDSLGKRLSVNDTVLVQRIPEELLKDLPAEDQDAINGCLGQFLTIVSFDSYGHAEIEFTDQQGNFHTIWIHTNCLLKQ
jgi:hypothetical protein